MVTPRRAISFGEANGVIVINSVLMSTSRHDCFIPQSPSCLCFVSFQVSVTPETSSSSGGKHCHVTVIDGDTKQAILSMSKPSDMDADERKRQYAAMSLGLRL